MSEELIKVPCQFGETGNFLLERSLGQGGMGGVYMGRDKMLDRPVAVKVMLKEYGNDAEFVEKFKKEAQAAAKLLHPNIAQIYSYGISDGMPYIAMEIATGGSLDSIMEHSGAGKTDVPRVMKICQQTAQALACAADRGLVHGDVKPENILLDSNGNAKLVDFGLAAMQKDTDEIWGTPYYISPEKVKKEIVDYRADMYSLGGTLYHALTGVPPFEGEDTTAVVKKRFTDVPKKPSELRPGLSPQIDALVMKMLAFNKEDRFPSFEALLEEFKQVLTTGLSETQKVSAKEPPKAGLGKPVASNGKKLMLKKKTVTLGSKTAKVASASVTGEIPAEGSDGANEAEKPADAEEDEEGGNLGLKVAGVIGGIIAAIGLVAGGLVWYKASNAAAEERANQEMLVSGINQAREAIAATLDVAHKYVEQRNKDAEDTVALMTEPTNQMKALFPEFASSIEPAGDGTFAQPPEGKELPRAVIDFQELWSRAQASQAAAKQIAEEVEKLEEYCKSADELSGNTPEVGKALGEISKEATRRFNDQVKNGKLIETMSKNKSALKTSPKTLVEGAKNQLRVAKEKKDREEAKAAKEKAIAEKKAALAAAKKQKAEEETQKIQDKFKEISQGRDFQRLDMDRIIKLLKQDSVEFTSPEGTAIAKLEIGKAEAIQTMQKAFIDNLKGYTFTAKKSDLKDAKVVEINDKDIIVLKSGSSHPIKVTWEKFYKNIRNFNEVINLYIVDGRKNSKKRPGLKDWSEGMIGSALTMRLLCADVPGADKRSQELVQQVAKDFPSCVKKLKYYFPEIELEASDDDE